MVWNEELALIAQRFADQCMDQCPTGEVFCHSELDTKLDGTTVGQNIVRAEGSSLVSKTYISSVELWYAEVAQFDSTTLPSFVEDPPTGHYTQLVWANSEEVGCGVVHFQDNTLETMIICNYAARGNVLGQPVYKQGPAGSDCPAEYTDNDGLCKKNKMKRINRRKKNKRRNKNKKYN
jgi:hypothetical protein